MNVNFLPVELDTMGDGNAMRYELAKVRWLHAPSAQYCMHSDKRESWDLGCVLGCC